MNDAYAVVERWAEAFNEGDAAGVAALYAADATIWGTLAQTLTTSPARSSTTSPRPPSPDLRVRLGEHVWSLISATSAIDTGHYEFTRTVDGAAIFPARHSFVLVKHDGAWMIAHQHSSFLPKPAGG
jgi:hypothetical protein